jgi:uncharacterized HAD superfamily protein
MREKKKVAVDFDDVIFDFNGHFAPWHNKHFGTNVSYESITSFTLSDVYGSTDAVMLERVRQFTHENHAIVQPIAGARVALGRLKEKYKLCVVTSRSETLKDVMHDWSRDNVHHAVHAYHFTNGFGGLDHHVKRTKSSICKEIDAVVHIEDAPMHAYEVSQSGVHVLLPDRPWNRNMAMPKNITRVYSWDEIEHWLYTHH